jgi:hypothetical protein
MLNRGIETMGLNALILESILFKWPKYNILQGHGIECLNIRINFV